ncbi:MAG: ribonuclease HII [Oscillospiraceae bacterium]|jgi:ribonuclease HII|nr:ribonuclease HII [Oscillospiraceae bacterium]
MPIICGVDEAGRGPLAGPVCAAAVILPEKYDLPFLNDSKALTEKRRELLFPQIIAQALCFSVAFAGTAEIERLNIREATKLAMLRAVEGLKVRPDELWIDGNMLIDAGIPAHAFVKGDALYPCISAASVLAKVTRDRHMLELDARYPEYGFARHKGYGTRLHARALAAHGPCPEHRALFVKTFMRRGWGE